MVSSTPFHRLTQSLRIVAILAVPRGLFCTTLLLLLIPHGGHHYAFISKNPYCNRAQPDAQPPLSNNSQPPQLVIHISDLHVSDARGTKVKQNLLAFERDILPRWAPLAHAVVVSGDLVHAIDVPRYPFGASSRQIPSEWAWLDRYAARVNRSIPWFSTHGNHDTFGGHLHHHARIIPLNTSTCPSQYTNSPHTRVRLHRLAANSLNIIAIDATVQHPLHRPLNFFGDASLPAQQLPEFLDSIHLATTSSELPPNVLLFGHYPSSVMTSGTHIHALAPPQPPGHSAQNTLQSPRFIAYLSGHLHTLHGLAKYGLQSVSKFGSLELETIDMVESAGYRILSFDGSSLSVNTYSMKPNYANHNFLDDVIVLNLPRAGLCSPGAGFAARRSTHIRFLSPHVNLQANDTIVYIDGQEIGRVVKFDHVCRQQQVKEEPLASETCLHMYGVAWRAAEFEAGIHQLALHANGTQSSPHVFSLDGSADTSSIHAMWTTAISILFGLSDFATMAPLLCNAALLLSVLFCIPGLRNWSAPSAMLAIFAVSLWLGLPMLVAKNLTVVDTGFGWISIRHSILPSASFASTVDVPFILSTKVIWAMLVPACFAQAVSNIGRARDVSSSRLFIVAMAMYLRHGWSCCLEILGAYGVAAMLLSPCCVPLLAMCVWSSVCLIRGTSVTTPVKVA